METQNLYKNQKEAKAAFHCLHFLYIRIVSTLYVVKKSLFCIHFISSKLLDYYIGKKNTD